MVAVVVVCVVHRWLSVAVAVTFTVRVAVAVSVFGT